MLKKLSLEMDKKMDLTLPNQEQDAKKRKERLSFWAQLRAWLLNRPVAWIVLFLGFLVALWTWNNAQEDLLIAQQAKLKSRASEVSEAIASRMRTYEQVLRGGVGMFAGSKSVSRSEFQEYIANIEIQEQYPGIQGIGYSVHIPAAKLDAHLDIIRAEGFPEYAIHPAGIRDQYTSIIYLEPFGWRNQRAFGFDMFSEVNRRAAMESARDTGRAAMSAKVTLVQETGKAVQPGVLMYLPLYKSGMPHITVAERNANLLGYIYSPFRLDDLMHGILKTKPGSAEPDIDMEIYGSEQLSAESLLYNDSGVTHMLSAPLPNRLMLTKSIDL
jgi:CHASE1-domain containing sensor protein